MAIHERMRWALVLGVMGCPELADDAGPDEGGTDAVDTGDTASVDCPASCDDGDACTEDTVVSGSADDCDLVCDHRDVSDDPDPFDSAFEDSNCDGTDGVLDDIVFLSTTGEDIAQCGTVEAPCATWVAASAAAERDGAAVGVMAGTHTTTFALRAGVDVVGGFDASGIRSNAEATVIAPSTPVDGEVVGLEAVDIDTATLVMGLEIAPTADGAAPGTNVIGVKLLNAGGVRLVDVVVTPGPGVAGAAGLPGDAGAAGLGGGSNGSAATGTALGLRDYLGGGRAPGWICGDGGASGDGGYGGYGGLDDFPLACGTNNINLPRGGDPGAFATDGDCRGAAGTAGANPNTCPEPNIFGTSGGTGGTCDEPAPDGELEGVSQSAVGSVGDDATWSAPAPQAVGDLGYGTHGGGGGGGGGGGAGDGEVCVIGGHGGGGGGGGAGGCGGAPGGGGAAGGASLALVLVDSDVSGWSGVTAMADDGGAGGAGGAGGTGGDGGPGGLGYWPGLQDPSVCDVEMNDSFPKIGGAGGSGQRGGDGAPGIGGPGGASVGAMLCRSSADGDWTAMAGAPGAAGAPGGDGGRWGSRGLALDVMEGCDLAPATALVGSARAFLEWFPIGGTAPANPPTDAYTCPAGFTFSGGGGGLDDLWLCVPDDFAVAPYKLAWRRWADNGWTSRVVWRGLAAELDDDTGCGPTWPVAGVTLEGGSVVQACMLAIPDARDIAPSAWVSVNATTRIDNTTIFVDPTTADPILISPNGLGLHPGQHLIEVVLESPTDSAAEIFFNRRGDPGFAQDRSVALPVVTGSNTLLFDMSTNPRWDATIEQLRFDPVATVGGEVTVTSFRVLP